MHTSNETKLHSNNSGACMKSQRTEGRLERYTEGEEGPVKQMWQKKVKLVRGENNNNKQTVLVLQHDNGWTIASGQKSWSNLEACQKLLRGSRRLTVGSCPAVTGNRSRRRQQDSTCTIRRYLLAALPDSCVSAVPSIPPTDTLLVVVVVVVLVASRRGVSAKWGTSPQPFSFTVQCAATVIVTSGVGPRFVVSQGRWIIIAIIIACCVSSI